VTRIVVESRIPQVIAVSRRQAQRAAESAAKEGARLMVQSAPRDSGAMAASIEARKDGDRWVVLVNHLREGRPYWHYIEYGTASGGWRRSATAAQPFVAPAMERAQRTFDRMLRSIFRGL
jgi:HK97 gp10 family phage protein